MCVVKPALRLAALVVATATSVFGYMAGNASWPDGSIPLHLQLQTGGPASAFTWNDVALGAITEWNSHLNMVQFTTTKNSSAPIEGNNGRNNVYWAGELYDQSLDPNLLGLTILWSSGPVLTEADIILNTKAAGSWSSYQGAKRPGSLDLHRVLSHELGHALGLLHPDEHGQGVPALMNSVIGDVDAPTADDIAAAKSLYEARTAPVIALQPSDIAVAKGGTAVFAVEVVSKIPYQSQWYKDGVLIDGAFGSSYTRSDVQAADTGVYTVKVSNAVGSTASRAARLTIAVGIDSQPVDQNVIHGATATFSVASSTQPGAQYQWRFNGAPIAGATGPSITISSVQLADEGAYTVTITSGSISVESQPAQLRIGLMITEQPVSRTVSPGGSATFSVRILDASALFRYPVGIAIDSKQAIYISDRDAHVIRKISAAGVVSTFAGANDQSGAANGQGASARFNGPHGLAIDAADNLYVADRYNSTIRKITPDGLVSLIAGDGITFSQGATDGAALTARFSLPSDIAVDPAGNVYVADQGNGTIRKITPAGMVSTLAGAANNRGNTDGTGADARFYGPTGITIDRDGNLYVADDSVRKVTPAGVVSTLPPPNSSYSASYGQTADVAVDAQKNVYVIAHYGVIYRAAPGVSGTVLAGVPLQTAYADGPGSMASFHSPEGIAVDASGNIYVADTLNRTIRKITPSGNVTTIAGRPRTTGTNNGTLAHYQWQKNGVDIPNATGPEYTVSNQQIGDGAAYSVVVTNSLGSLTSNRATLAVGHVPTITVHPVSQIVERSLRLTTFSVVAEGAGPFTYQWRANGIVLDETGPTLSVANLTSDAKTYTVVVSNAAGSATSEPATLTVGRDPPSIVLQPADASLQRWDRITLEVSVDGAHALSYQWKKNGAPIPGAIEPRYLVVAAQPADSGVYTVDVSNLFGRVTSRAATVTVANSAAIPDNEAEPIPGQQPTSKLVNISARGYCSISDRVMIGGFVVNGSTPKRVLVRAVGPSLASQGLAGNEVLQDPTIQVYHGAAVIASNDNWVDNTNAAEVTSVGAQIGANALSTDDTRSSALLLTLAPGVYSFIASGKNGGSGIVLLEVYEAGAMSGSAFANISTRAYATTGSGLTIGGFVIAGSQPKRVLLRAVGPTLMTMGISQADVLMDPTIELHQGAPVMNANDNWGENANAAEITTTATRIGATPFATNDKTSSALLVTLQPGVYSFLASGKSSASGVVLVEVYDAD